MANGNNKWISKFQADQDADKKRIDDALNTSAAPWIIGAILAVGIIWSIVDTFL